jgi:hypothetical protein
LRNGAGQEGFNLVGVSTASPNFKAFLGLGIEKAKFFHKNTFCIDKRYTPAILGGVIGSDNCNSESVSLGHLQLPPCSYQAAQ